MVFIATYGWVFIFIYSLGVINLLSIPLSNKTKTTFIWFVININYNYNITWIMSFKQLHLNPIACSWTTRLTSFWKPPFPLMFSAFPLKAPKAFFFGLNHTLFLLFLHYPFLLLLLIKFTGTVNLEYRFLHLRYLNVLTTMNYRRFYIF